MIFEHQDHYDPSGGARGCLTVIVFTVIVVGLAFAIGILTMAGVS